MGKIDPNYRPDFRRSVLVSGELTDPAVSDLAKQILELRHSDDLAPVTVFINSNGGSIRCLSHLYGILSAQGVSGTPPWVITIAIGNAKSAAATLLAWGNYAIAYPDSSIHFHGTRYSSVEDVTVEAASSMAAQLDSSNRAMAGKLARSGAIRLAFHYTRFKEEFQRVRSDNESETLSDLECFARILRGHLSANGRRILDQANARWQHLQRLSKEVMTVVRAKKKAKQSFEAAVLKRIIDFEESENERAGRKLNSSGVYQIINDYFLLRDYDLGQHVPLVRMLVDRYGSAFFDATEIDAVVDAYKKGGADGEAAQALIMKRLDEQAKPFSYFATSIWQNLQQDENPLTPKDAYWLGAVDEVYDSGLPCLRDIAEADESEIAANEATAAPASEQ